MTNRENEGAGSPAPSTATRTSLWRGVDQASVMTVELMAAILTWTGIGWLVDQWLGTMPWFLVGGALLGNTAGIYLLWLRSGREAHGWKPDAGAQASEQQGAPERRAQGGSTRESS